jgi:hypothetical protein
LNWQGAQRPFSLSYFLFPFTFEPWSPLAPPKAGKLSATPNKEELQGMIKFLAGSCLSELGIVLKEPNVI